MTSGRVKIVNKYRGDLKFETINMNKKFDLEKFFVIIKVAINMNKNCDLDKFFVIDKLCADAKNQIDVFWKVKVSFWLYMLTVFNSGVRCFT